MSITQTYSAYFTRTKQWTDCISGVTVACFHRCFIICFSFKCHVENILNIVFSSLWLSRHLNRMPFCSKSWSCILGLNCTCLFRWEWWCRPYWLCRLKSCPSCFKLFCLLGNWCMSVSMHGLFLLVSIHFQRGQIRISAQENSMDLITWIIFLILIQSIWFFMFFGYFIKTWSWLG